MVSVLQVLIVLFMKEMTFLLESHEQLIHDMGNNDDFLCALLLPLTVATADELTEEENEEIPVDLQYLPSNTQLEPDRDIQQILLETILLVRCAKS